MAKKVAISQSTLYTGFLLVITINALNDPPSGTDNTVSTAEDTAYTFTAADFGFSDPNDTPVQATDVGASVEPQKRGDAEDDGHS